MNSKVVKVPQIMQLESLECGAACLAMILAYYGKWVPLEQVRRDCGVSRDGSRALNVLKAAKSYGLDAKGIALSAEKLREKGSFPCIAFWDFNHFVVVDGFKGKNVYLNDPARGEVKIPIEEFEKSFSGVALFFEKGESFEPSGSKPNSLDYAKKRVKGMEIAILFVMLTAAIHSLLSILNTSTGKVFIDHILSGKDPQWLQPLILIMSGLAAVTVVVSILEAVYLVRMEGKISVVSSSRFMDHLLRLPVEFFSQRYIGDLQLRQAENELIISALIGKLAPVLINAVMLILYILIMFKYSVMLTAVGILTVLLNALMARYISIRRVNISRAMASANGKFYASGVSGIEMIESIKAAGAENGFFEKWAGHQALVNESRAKMNKINEYLGVIPAALTQFANILVLVLGVWLILEGNFTPGALMAFNGFLAAFINPVSQMISLGQGIQEMQTSMERVEDVMRYPADGNETPAAGNAVSGMLSGKIDLENVSFGYSPLDPPLIKDFSLHVQPGQWVAIVGSSGSGKSTVAKLISGLYPVWSGEIRFDDMPMRDIPKPVLRGSMAMVDQDIVSFNDTVANNIKLWDDSIENYAVILAARDADIHDEIISRPGGYQSMVQPGGRNFSGGELQRLEIAHVLAMDPSILILDEATSALDAKTEERVIRAIRERGITCIVVAHRLSTIRDCDEIIVLDNGSVVERGTHEELMSLDGTYAALVRSD